jgi:hypothetical protein
MGGVLTFRHAATVLRFGSDVYAGRKLRRLVLAKERRAGVQIAVRGEGKERPIRGVTMAAIQQHLPEILPSGDRVKDAREALIAECRGYLREFDENTARIARAEAEAAIGEIVQPQIDDLRVSNDETLRLCTEIAKRLNRTTGADVGGDRKTASESETVM